MGDMAQEVLAPLAGEVLSLAVEVGLTVEEDDEVLVLEALKMETVVYAPCDGHVGAIAVKVGDQVEEDDPLATIE
jgi:acetyl-CoA carboxylase biotin carboxyl carrier protein